ncbi:MAG: translation initiation factor IF-2 [Deltaproteobacteria bacterium]|nr:translation initiation factor IF-2 [Deltaproteobacteria bacterium]
MTEDKKEMEEKRVKPTVIRRRAAPTPPVVPSAEKPSAPVATKAGETAVSKPTTTTITTPRAPTIVRPGAPIRITAVQPRSATAAPTITRPEQSATPVVTGKETKEEEKIRKGAKRKKSKAELELEDIQRAGGLKQFATQELTGVEGEVEPEVEPGAEPEPEPEAIPVERVYEPTRQMGQRKKSMRREFQKTQVTETSSHKKKVSIEKAISVSDLSKEMGVKVSEIIKKLMGMGMMVTANQSIDVDAATLIAADFGYEVIHTAFKEEEVLKSAQVKVGDQKNTKLRSPVVTVMGHVDHGKTSLLDKIRKTNVTAGEAGGITQHIGAYQVHTKGGNITFIDTPGHAAFTRMRARGAQITDIVVLVVAADDGIMPQTIEAIDHAKAAGVPIIVAMNKMDKPQADVEKVKRGLADKALVSEDWGGDVICCPVSAKSGDGLDHLLEMILLVGQMKELKATFEGTARGVVIESRLDKGRGVVASVLIQSGLLKHGDSIVAGLSYGRVRAMTNDAGEAVKEAGPSQPIEILGLQDVPEAGEELFVVASEKDARQVFDTRLAEQRKKDLGGTAKLTLESLQALIATGESKELGLVVKADVDGSREALVESLQALGTEEVKIKIIHSGTGAITENDCLLARASNAIIIGFNVSAEGKARKFAKEEGIEILSHAIIYEVLDEIKKAMQGLLKPKTKETVMGRGLVKLVFRVTKVGAIAGLGVTDGVIQRSNQIRLIRDGKIIYTGKISSLKHFKDDVREISSGNECGLGIENFNDLKEGDEIEAFKIETVPA